MKRHFWNRDAQMVGTRARGLSGRDEAGMAHDLAEVEETGQRLQDRSWNPTTKATTLERRALDERQEAVPRRCITPWEILSLQNAAD